MTGAEWKLLLAACAGGAGESDIVRIAATLKELEPEKPLDWQKVVRLADHHGTSSLLHPKLAPCADVVPSTVLASLRHDFERNVRQSLFLAHELIRVLDGMEEHGVEVIPYKGIALSELYYGDMAVRQSGDIDLFVRKGDVARGKNVLRELGYVPRTTIPQNAEADYVATAYEWAFDNPEGKNLLELQWALQPRFYAVDLDMDGPFERAETATVAGRRVKTFAPEDLLLMLAVHAAKHVWGRLIWLCDIAQILQRRNLNWDRVQARARELGIQRILHLTLLLGNRFLSMAIPAPMEQAIRADLAAHQLAEEIAVAVAAGVSYVEPQVSYFRLMMRLRERRVDRMRFLSRLTFTPGPGEWEAVRLPRVLAPVYRVVRLGRLAARFARGSG